MRFQIKCADRQRTAEEKKINLIQVKTKEMLATIKKSSAQTKVKD